MIEILVNNEALDLASNVSIPLELNNPLFGTVGERKTSYSFSFSIPASNTNRRILGFPDQIDLESPQETYDAELKFNGITRHVGDLVIRDAASTGYKVNLQVTKSTWIDGKPLNEVVGDPDIWPPTNFAYAFHYPRLSVDITNNSGTAQNDFNFSGNEEIPFIFLKSFLEETFRANGWTLTIDWDSRLDDLLFYFGNIDVTINPSHKHEFLYSTKYTFSKLLSELEKRFCLTVGLNFNTQVATLKHNFNIVSGAQEISYDFNPDYMAGNVSLAKNYQFEHGSGTEWTIPNNDPDPYEANYDEHIIDKGFDSDISVPIDSYFLSENATEANILLLNYLLSIGATKTSQYVDILKLQIREGDDATHDNGSWNLTLSGITAELWEKWINQLVNMRPIERILYLTNEQLSTFDFENVINLNGDRFFAKTLKTSLKNKNVSRNTKFAVKAELFLLR